MLIGYARVSTQDQTLNLQKDALEKLGCNKIFTDTASGTKTERNGLEEALEYVREGDTLVVWRLDRLGRSLKHLIETITELNNRKKGLKVFRKISTQPHPEENLSFIFSEHSLNLSGILFESERKRA
jgi:DNA invertase Pin-like site-specific DNA recombinase